MTSRKHRSRDRDQNIGAALRHHRIARGLSQPKLGDMIGVCHQQIQKYENGTDRLAASTAVDLAEQFGVTVDELLGLNGNTPPLNQLKNEIRALLKRNDWQHEDAGFYPRAALGELLMRAREIIEADVGRQPPVGKRKGGEGKVNQNWRRLLDACSTQPGYYIALSERHAKRFIADAKAARTGEGKSPKNEPVK
jgi:transcriptional regulator with XRE-family HTH domain